MLPRPVLADNVVPQKGLQSVCNRNSKVGATASIFAKSNQSIFAKSNQAALNAKMSWKQLGEYIDWFGDKGAEDLQFRREGRTHEEWIEEQPMKIWWHEHKHEKIHFRKKDVGIFDCRCRCVMGVD